MGTIASVAVHYYELAKSPRRRLRADSFDIFEPREKYATPNDSPRALCNSGCPLLL
jgi:hypothetical protein